ncbi:MAG: MFS transporter, partial [Myxococcales bacterium]|nr:MFS transporter [Myxococcales bacterium]
LLVVIGVLSATHDIACDGYYMDALDEDAQARMSGLRVAAFRVAMLVGNAGLVYVGGRFGWLAGFGFAAVMFVALAAFHQLKLPRGESERRREPAADREDAPQRAASRLRHVATAYLSFLGQRGALVVLLFITTYKLGDALMFSMGKVLLRDLGVGTETRALINLVSVLSMIAGATLAGAWIARAGLRRCLLTITLLMALSEPLYLLLAGARLPMQLAAAYDVPSSVIALLWRPSLLTIAGVLAIEQFAGGMATAAQMIFIMRRCHPDHKAAHYAFATALYAFAQMATGTYSGHLYEAQGPVIYFAVTSVACIPALLLVNLIPTERRAA